MTLNCRSANIDTIHRNEEISNSVMQSQALGLHICFISFYKSHVYEYFVNSKFYIWLKPKDLLSHGENLLFFSSVCEIWCAIRQSPMEGYTDN